MEALESQEKLKKRQLTTAQRSEPPATLTWSLGAQASARKEDRSDLRMDEASSSSKVPSPRRQTKPRLDVKVLEDSLVENLVKVMKDRLSFVSSVMGKYEKLRSKMLPLTQALQESEDQLQSAKSENKSLLKLNDDQKEELKRNTEINNTLEVKLKEVEDQNEVNHKSFEVEKINLKEQLGRVRLHKTVKRYHIQNNQI